MSPKYFGAFVLGLFLFFPQIVISGNMYMYYGPYKHSKTYERQHQNDYKPAEPVYPEYDGWGNPINNYEYKNGVKYESTEEERSPDQDRNQYQFDSSYAEEAGCCN